MAKRLLPLDFQHDIYTGATHSRGRAADRVATAHIFNDYRKSLAANTRRRHAAGLARCAALLQAAGIEDVHG
jgi:hypothetical protein